MNYYWKVETQSGFGHWKFHHGFSADNIHEALIVVNQYCKDRDLDLNLVRVKPDGAQEVHKP